MIRQIFEEAPSKMVKSGVILRDAIDVVDGIDFHASENVHTLSHLYESLLVRMGREGGMSGEFYTPRPIIKFMVEMVAPQLGETVYDPAAGSAGFLVEAYGYMEEHHVRLAADRRKLQDATFFGQEKKPLPYLLGVMNCVLHGITVPRIVRTNTLSADVRKFSERDRYHVILTNPPFGGTEDVNAVKSNFPYPSSATSILFLQHIMKRLRRDGRVGMVIDEGVLFKTSGGRLRRDQARAAGGVQPLRGGIAARGGVRQRHRQRHRAEDRSALFRPPGADAAGVVLRRPRGGVQPDQDPEADRRERPARLPGDVARLRRLAPHAG